MPYSLTYSGVIVMILGFIFQSSGLPFDAGQAEQAIQFIIAAAGAVMALVGRYRAGGVNAFGAKK